MKYQKVITSNARGGDEDQILYRFSYDDGYELELIFWEFDDEAFYSNEIFDGKLIRQTKQFYKFQRPDVFWDVESSVVKRAKEFREKYLENENYS